MKFISLSLLPILASFLVISASAGNIESRGVEANPSANAQTAITYISDSKNSGAINPVCFYSGQTTVKKVVKGKTYSSTKTAEAALGAFKGSPRNCLSITEVIGKAGINPTSFSANDWKLVSKALGEHVSGKAYVLLGKDIRSNSVWITDEKPALKANSKVTLEVWEIETDGSVTKTNKTKANV